MNQIDELLRALQPEAVTITENAYNLTLTREQFEQKLLREPDGLELLRICELLGPACEPTIEPCLKGGRWYVRVPRWLDLLTFLRKSRVDVRLCGERTARGNVYASELDARRAAGVMTAKHNSEITAQPCRVCKKWHLRKFR